MSFEMKNKNFARKVKELRIRKGFSQEQLSEESKLSLRTIQRIEKGESIPRGDTIIKLTQALGTTTDDILERVNTEDKGYLTLLNLSALTSPIFHPMLGIIIPLVMWILKKDKIKFIDGYGKKIINFQITWTLLIYSVLIIASKGSYIKYDINIFNILSWLINLKIDKELVYIVFLGLFYLYNLTLIFKNVRKINKGKKIWCFPSIPFFR
ncbi:helix-turn-helix domain-containing protein [Pseudotenacibaculum haliotis]|uniref:Helix-turn-helix domain-containing protein n=1 Tax=Pseudotenacibaculum haliotis TaxID=1862138 RepID=A0ABW5LU76_9FLAO